MQYKEVNTPFLHHKEVDQFYDCEADLGDPIVARTHPFQGSAVDQDLCDMIDINAFDAAVDLSKYDPLDLTVDSGDGDAVANPKDFPECTVNESLGSLSRQVYMGHGGERLPNKGPIKPAMLIEGGRTGTFGFQAVPGLRKPLLAVSSVNDKGNLVLFDEKGSFIIPGCHKELIKQLRALVKQIPDESDLQRKNGVFHMKAWKLKPGFTR